jgi:hypothetical protein
MRNGKVKKISKIFSGLKMSGTEYSKGIYFSKEKIIKVYKRTLIEVWHMFQIFT